MESLDIFRRRLVSNLYIAVASFQSVPAFQARTTKEAAMMRTTHFDQMLKQQERAQPVAAKRARARSAQTTTARKSEKTASLDFLAGIFLVAGVAIAAGGMLAELAF